MSAAGRALPALGVLTGATLRLWRLDGAKWRLLAGESATAAPRAPRGDAPPATSWLAIPDAPGLFLEIVPGPGGRVEEIGGRVMPIVESLLDAERESVALTTELASRYEEIDLLYTIGELLGRSARRRRRGGGHPARGGGRGGRPACRTAGRG